MGHPLVDEIAAIRKEGVREPSLVGLFPGSRNREIDRHFPVFAEVVRRLSRTRPDLKFETAASNEALAERMRGMARKAGMSPDIFNITVGRYHELMDRAAVGVVASGTATMEAALHRLPYMLVYKVPLLTYWMARMLIKIRFIGMVNILAEKPVVKELIQFDFTPDKVIEEIERLLVPENRDALLAEMKRGLGQAGAGRSRGTCGAGRLPPAERITNRSLHSSGPACAVAETAAEWHFPADPCQNRVFSLKSRHVF